MKHYKYIAIGVILLAVVLNCASVSQIDTVDTIIVPNQIKPEEKPEVQKLENTISVKENITKFDSNEQEQKWVDSIYNQMTIDDKIGQLFMVSAYSNKDEKHISEIEKLITDYKIGGVIFFQGGPVRQAKMTNRFQAKTKIPLFIAIDAEWGLSMRLDSTYRYPYNMTLGAIKDLNLLKKLGEQMGKQSNRLGIHFNFAPDIDINTNPKNPIIGNRSFGEDKVNVTNKATALMVGLQSQKVIATGKHFPGHGDTETDSHKALPTIAHSKERLNEVELYPYKKMFASGLQSVMVAHLNVPSLEKRENRPSSLSYPIVTDLLQKELGFEGLIFTDALNMKGASNFKKPGEIDLEAFNAGNDILLCPENVPAAVEIFKNALQKNALSEKRLEKSVKKILSYKYKVGLNAPKIVDTNNLVKELNPPSNDSLQYALYENAITLLKNEKDILPIKDLRQKIAYVKLGDDSSSTFVNALKSYTDVTVVKENTIEAYKKTLDNFDLVIIGFHKTDKPWKNQDFTKDEINMIQEIAKSNKVILDVFAKPYTLLPFTSFKNIETVLVSYQNNDISEEVSAEIIFGAVIAKGSLPVSINKFFFANKSLTTTDLKRLGYSNPEYVGIDSAKLYKIEDIVNKAIQSKITPGIQILVARKGKIVYQKSFGYQSYEKKIPIQNNTIYDIASISKMIGTLPMVIKQYDKKRLKLDSKLGDFFPIFKNTNKDSIQFKDLMTHQARLQAWIPFYKATLDSTKNKMPNIKYYRKIKTDSFSIPVAKDLYLRNDYRDTIFQKIIDSKLADKKQYKYSDLTFIILKEYLEYSLKKPLDKLVQKEFFQSIGMNNTMFNPYTKKQIDSIPPTEIDTYFRHELIQGYVHDMEAAMEGGVAGHAGLFSNTQDIAKMMQLYLQKGYYGGLQYFSPETFDVFNTCYFCKDGNRRGLGFDKPQLGKEGPTCGCVSTNSFGHTGFTGGIAWADPDSELIYVFLSNRTFPDSNAANKLSRENIPREYSENNTNFLKINGIKLQKNMKIAIVCYPTFGGSGVVATELGLELARRGHEIHFITYSQPVRLALLNHNVFYHEVNVPEYPLFHYQPYELALSSKLVETVKKYKIDLLHVHYAIPHAYAGYMAKQMLKSSGINLPMVTTLHGTDITLVGNHPDYKLAVAFSINQSDIVTSVSKSLKEDTYTFFNIDKEIEVIPNFIEINSNLENPFPCKRSVIAQPNEKIITHISNFRKVKRIKDVVEIFYRIQKQIPSKLMLVGDGPERIKAENLLNSLGIQDKVIFFGNSSEINEILSNSDLFLLPSETESFGLAALELMAWGVPVISSNTGGLPEVNINGVSGFLSNVGDVDTMAKNAIEILHNNSTLETFKTQAFEVAKQFDIINILPMYEAVYKKALQIK